MSRLQKGLIAASAVLVVVAGYSGYARYQAEGPAPFDPSRPEIKEQFLRYMQDGATAWEHYLQGQDHWWPVALENYALAYQAHPRDRDASRALREIADRVLEDYPDRRVDHATMLAQHSPDYLAKYGPVAALASATSGPGEQAQ
jgi:hypothetical protein